MFGLWKSMLERRKQQERRRNEEEEQRRRAWDSDPLNPLNIMSPLSPFNPFGIYGATPAHTATSGPFYPEPSHVRHESPPPAAAVCDPSPSYSPPSYDSGSSCSSSFDSGSCSSSGGLDSSSGSC